MESSFQIAACECPDVSANTMAVDATGRFVLISGRKSIALVDLEGASPESSSSQNTAAQSTSDRLVTSSSGKLVPTKKKYTRNSKYEPTASQFNKHLSDLYALTTYQAIEVFSIEDLNPSKPKLVLRGHSRAIADLEWSHFDPYLLGSTGADCFTNLWDIRDSRRPSANLTSVSGATQVRFSKTSSNLIATSHEIDVRIWDIRQPNLPLNYIAAHLQKINGMDWNPNKTSCDHEQLITCSQDNTVKIWDLNMSKIKPSATLATRTPAWRIRYTPTSSNAILTSTLPQLRSRTECMALRLWSMKPNRFEQKKLELILGLVGHTDIVVDFDWRASSSSSSTEIISWSKDQSLRIWRVDNQIIEMNVENSDYEAECDSSDVIGEPIESYLNDSPVYPASPDVQSATLSPRTRTPDSASVRSPSKLASQARKREDQLSRASLVSPSTDDQCDSEQDEESSDNLSSANELKQEFNLINKNIPNIEFEELNSLRRVCLVTARAKSVTCRLRIALPPSYPQNDCPTFTIIDSNQFGGAGLSRETKDKLLQLLNETAKVQLSRSRNCIEPCLRKFIAALQSIISHNVNRRTTSSSGLDYKDDPITLSAQRDHSVPFPNTSGARFCGNLLVCFSRPIIPALGGGGDTANWSVETPRSMAQLSAQLDNMRRQGSYNLSNISISYFYYGAMRRNEIQSRNAKAAVSGRLGPKYIAGRGKAPHGQAIMSKSYKCGPVLVYDVSNILGGISRSLAESYVFDKDVMKMCRKNAEIAAEYNRKDLVQIWSLAELSSEGVLHSHTYSNKDDELPLSLLSRDSDFGDRPWTMHPFGSKLIQSLIDHYVYNCHDVQTAAMLVWTFSSPKLGRSNRGAGGGSPRQSSGKSNQSNGSALHQTVAHGTKSSAINSVDSISDEWSFVNGPESHLYSNSWSNLTIHEHLADYQMNEGTTKCSSKNNNGEDQSTNGFSSERFPKIDILSPERSLQNDLIMHIYAEVLYKLNLLNQRAMVLKNVGASSSYLQIFGDRQAPTEHPEDRLSNLRIQCANGKCRASCRSAQCSSCKKYTLYCSICRLPVKGSSSVCIKCLHGGHINHFSTWFQSYDFCPTGCGCQCSRADH